MPIFAIRSPLTAIIKRFTEWTGEFSATDGQVAIPADLFKKFKETNSFYSDFTNDYVEQFRKKLRSRAWDLLMHISMIRADIIVGCIHGDPDKPIGLATIPNANTISPVRNANKHEGVIRTAGGNEIVLDDLDAKQKITVKTAASNKLLLDDEHKKRLSCSQQLIISC